MSGILNNHDLNPKIKVLDESFSLLLSYTYNLTLRFVLPQPIEMGGGKQNKVVIGCVRERDRQTFRVLVIIEEK